MKSMGKVGIEAYRLTQILYGTVVITFSSVCITTTVMSHGTIGIETDRLVIFLDRPVVIALFGICYTSIHGVYCQLPVRLLGQACRREGHKHKTRQ